MVKQKAKKLSLNLANQPRWVLAITGVSGLILAYGIFSRALDTGSWWEYLAGLVLTVQAVRWLIQVIKGNEHKTK